MRHPLAFVLAAAALSMAAVERPAGRVPHDGPDPVGHWIFTVQRFQGDTVDALLGPNLQVHGDPTIESAAKGEAARLDGQGDAFVAGTTREALGGVLPKKLLTVAAWVAVDAPTRWGGIAGFIQDNGEAEKGWVLGYDDRRFTFALASTGADDGDGAMTYLTGQTEYELGRLYHVVGTYDGEVQKLYVNGVLEAIDRTQSGDVLYPEQGPLALGAYWDQNERHGLQGRLRSVALYDVCATDKWVAEEFDHDKGLTEATAVRVWPEVLEFVVRPYLQFVTQDGVTVMWETSRPAESDAAAKVRYGPTVETMDQVATATAGGGGGQPTIHEVTLSGLEPGPYVYAVETVDDRGEVLQSEIRTFQTAVAPDTPFAFAIISDTQGNPQVSGRIAEHAFGQRPNFALIPGDLVDTGSEKGQWVNDFFASMEPLVSRVAFFPVLGNHEQNARHYYNYVALPDPEYFYTFRYGNAQFFIVDSNKKVDPTSEQYRWLQGELAGSQATWKFVSFHHPVYSSDENDYGDMWKGRSTQGDLRMRPMAELFDQYGVDVVWNGHIHSYERTWPVREGKVEVGGTVYMITGGGGGSLETPGPTRPFFQNNVRRGHHYCMVAIAGGRLEFKAFDLDNRLFDTVVLEK